MNTQSYSANPFTKNNTNGVAIELCGDLSLTNNSALLDKLNTDLEKYDFFEISISEVESIDIPFIQLMHSFEKTAKSYDKKVTVRCSLSPDIKAIIGDAGFNEKLGLD
ncbi:MAG: hypothetical protein CSA05_00225 [Bacteroidia bacterium]|nr:MAG: hypothetical protein CSA05_00225 [Bacteroidia bacterium]